MTEPREARDGANDRNINWLAETTQFIYSDAPDAACCAEYVAERLAALFLERLPPELGSELLALLPAHELRGRSSDLGESASSGRNSSIGFTDFVERARQALGCFRAVDLDLEPDLPRRVAEIFLWSLAHPLPAGFKERIAANLPAEIRFRMNLASDASAGSRVA